MSQENKKRGYIQRQGDLHEESALKLIGGDAVNLNNNEKLRDMGLRGNNYPTYDILSSTEICSVKSHISENGSANTDAYLNDFGKMLGDDRAYEGPLSPVQQDAERLMDCAARGLPVPEAVKNASPEQVASYLQESSVLRIPSDHVGDVRQELLADAKQLPEKYALPENPTAEQLQKLADRVQSTDLSSTETLKQLNAEFPESTKKSTNRVQVKIDHTQENVKDGNSVENPENEDYHYGYGF